MLGGIHEHRTLFVSTFVCCWVVLALTSPGIPIVWDEGEYFVRSKFIIQWFELLPRALSTELIRRQWLFIHYAEGHPAGFALPIALGQWLGSPFIDPLLASRLGPITLFSGACAALAVHLKRTYGTAAAIVTPVALLTFPRIFSEAHFATQDGQLTAWWLLLWAVQSSFAPEWRGAMGLGLILGFTTATKFTGWLAWPPTVISEILHSRVAALRRLSIVLPLAILIFYVVNPPMWYDPLDGFREHFHRSLNRAETLNITTQFLGQSYSVERPLPWYNTVVWLAFTTPLPTLALGVVGLVSCLRTRTALSLTLILHWITLMIVRALPGAPPHDGIRLFLPAFGFWCVFAGIGAQRAFDAIRAIPAIRGRVALRLALSAALLANAVNLARYYPQTLSHYSLIAGGLRGAADKGMEPAYWWDALDTDVLRWLNEHTDPSEAIAFSPASNIGFLRDWRGLRPKQVQPNKEPFKWYVLQNRPGVFSRLDRALVQREKPAFVKYAGRRSARASVPSDLSVPLIWIFSFDQYQRARHRER